MQLTIGLITVFAIILVPVYVFIVASFVGKPRAPKVTLLILGLPTVLATLAIAFTFIIGALFSLIVP